MCSLTFSNITSATRAAVAAAIFVLILTICIRPLVAGSGTPFEVLSGDMITSAKQHIALKASMLPNPGKFAKAVTVAITIAGISPTPR